MTMFQETYDDYPGDYDQDDYPDDRTSALYSVPENVKYFLHHFKLAISKRNLYEIQNLYEHEFPKLSDQYYENSTWPEAEVIAPLVDHDKTFLVLYNELYYRHIYARVSGGPNLNQRFDSFSNYCELFNFIINTTEPVPLELPAVWLWELIDEFVYQFQCYTQYRSRVSKKSVDELKFLNSNNKIWNILCVLNVLHSLVDKSNIKRQLEVYASGGDPHSVAGDFGKHSLYKMLGYYSLVGLLRLHSLLGDYYQAIKVLENIEVHKKSQYTNVPACQITCSYFVGFAYMMMRRYADAIRTFTSILLYIQRTKQVFQSKTYQNDAINKQTDQMYHLLAICLVLHPQCIDESIQQVLREKNYHEKMYKMQMGDLKEFEDCFLYACPKFLSATPPSIADPSEATTDDYVKEAVKHQTQVFMDEVNQQKMLPTIRSYLKLYTTLPLSKLATFMMNMKQTQDSELERDIDKEIKNLTTHLLAFKHKMKNVVWTKGPSGLEGTFQSGSELDFYIDNEMIHIADTKVAHRYGDFFIRKIIKFEEQNKKLQSIKIN